MDLASRIVSVLLGLAVMVFVLWPVTIPVGFSEAWWARQQIAPRSEPTPPPSPAQAPEPEATPPAPSVAPQAALPAPAPPAQVASPDTSRHAIQPGAGEGKKTLLAGEKAEAERLAALKSKDATAAVPPAKTKLYYKVRVRDAGTIESAGIVIRLDGIVARDGDAKCKDEKGKTWACGAAARVALARLIRTRAVTCALPKSGAQKDFAARCAVAGTDLSTWLVRQGWATPNEPSEPALAKAAEAAKTARIGIWRGVE